MAVVVDTQKSQKDIHARIKAAGLRKTWKKVKTSEIRKMKKDDKKEGERAAKIFDKGMGPKIDAYYKELSKFPDTTAQKVQKKALAVFKVMKTYEKSINSNNDFSANSRLFLQSIFEHFRQAMDEDLKWYLKRLPG